MISLRQQHTRTGTAPAPAGAGGATANGMDDTTEVDFAKVSVKEAMSLLNVSMSGDGEHDSTQNMWHQGISPSRLLVPADGVFLRAMDRQCHVCWQPVTSTLIHSAYKVPEQCAVVCSCWCTLLGTACCFSVATLDTQI